MPLFFCRTINTDDDTSDFFIAAAPSEEAARAYFDDPITILTEIEPLNDRHINVNYGGLTLLSSL